MKAYTAKLVTMFAIVGSPSTISAAPVTDANAKELKLAHFMLPIHDLKKIMFD